MIGRVVSIKMSKTAVVLVERHKQHPLYKKSFLRSKKYLIDDPLGVKMGDMVEFKKIKPVSKRKHHQIIKVIGRNIEEMVEEELKGKAAELIKEVMPEEKEQVTQQTNEPVNQKDQEKKPKKKVRKEKTS